jgi:hypothetical protein
VQDDGLGRLNQGQNTTANKAAPSIAAEESQGHGLLGHVSSAAVATYPEYLVKAVVEAAASLGMPLETYVKYFDAALVASNQLMEVRANGNRSLLSFGRLCERNHVLAGLCRAANFAGFSSLALSTLCLQR